jgi:SAM-dependent methyltransferase
VSVWHEQDDFWETMAPKIFTRLHWEAAPIEVDNILAVLNLPESARVLDLCCGPGRHSLELARRGFQVTGVDRTVLYLDRAREQAAVEELHVEFVQDDMRTFRRPGAYDAVLNMYSSFGYFASPDEDRQVLKNIHASLKDGGRLLMDMMGKEVLATIFQERDWHENDGVLFLEERKISGDWNYIQNRWIMIDGDARAEFEFPLRIYSGTELSRLLAKCGFRSVQLYGDLPPKPYDQNANRLVALAVK